MGWAMSDEHKPIGKAALARRLSARLGLSQQAAETMLEETAAEIGRALAHGEGVALRGFGTWRLVRRDPRQGSIGGHAFTTPAHMAVAWRPAAALADRVAQLDA